MANYAMERDCDIELEMFNVCLWNSIWFDIQTYYIDIKQFSLQSLLTTFLNLKMRQVPASQFHIIGKYNTNES